MIRVPPASGDSDHPTRSTGHNPAPRRVALAQLMGGAAEVIIEHQQQDYRLRVTANGKLILTK